MHAAAQELKKEIEFSLNCANFSQMHINCKFVFCGFKTTCVLSNIVCILHSSHVGRQRHFGIDVEWPARQGANLERLVFHLRWNVLVAAGSREDTALGMAMNFRRIFTRSPSSLSNFLLFYILFQSLHK